VAEKKRLSIPSHFFAFYITENDRLVVKVLCYKWGSYIMIDAQMSTRMSFERVFYKMELHDVIQAENTI
jgi:hypothetical protein